MLNMKQLSEMWRRLENQEAKPGGWKKKKKIKRKISQVSRRKNRK